MDLSGKNELILLSGIIADIQSVASGNDFLIVGAMARDLILEHGYGVASSRATTDLDLGFSVSGWPEFGQIRESILESPEFDSGNGDAHRFRHRKTGLSIDIVPFGGIEQADGTIQLPNESVMGVIGFAEAHATATEILLPNDQNIFTACLSMQAILKLLAWSERHTYTPKKDASDLILILSNYVNDDNRNDFYSSCVDQTQHDDFDYVIAGAWFAGMEAAECIVNSSKQPNRIFDATKTILEAETDQDGSLHLVGESGGQPELVLKLLGAFRDGMRMGRL